MEELSLEAEDTWHDEEKSFSGITIAMDLATKSLMHLL